MPFLALCAVTPALLKAAEIKQLEPNRNNIKIVCMLKEDSHRIKMVLFSSDHYMQNLSDRLKSENRENKGQHIYTLSL